MTRQFLDIALLVVVPAAIAIALTVTIGAIAGWLRRLANFFTTTEGR